MTGLPQLIRSLPAACAAGAGIASLAWPHAAGAATYTHVQIASGSSATTSVSAGEVNAFGHVAYSVDGPAGVSGVYVGSGAGLPIKVIDDAGGQYTSFRRPDINCHGHVVVAAVHSSGATHILYQAGGASPAVIYSGLNVGDPAMNDFDDIVFVDVTFDAISLVPGPNPSFGVNLDPEIVPGDVSSLHPRIDINNSGEIAYGVKLSAGGQAMRLWTMSGPNCDVQTGVGFKDQSSVVINGQGKAGYFWAPNYQQGICGSHSLLAGNPGSIYYRTGDMNWHSAPCFVGGGSGFSASIYAGPFYPADILVSAGGTVPGYPGTIESGYPFQAFVDPVHNNNSGSVAYAVKFTNGTWGVFRADRFPATPEPEGCPGLSPDNDLFGAALPIGDGVIEFSSEYATTDGPDLPESCNEGFGTYFVNDVWFLYTAPASGCIEASMCNAVDFDSRLAIYEFDANEPGELLACNDDAVGCFLSSRAQFVACAGRQYLIRVGSYFSGWGSGTLSVGPAPAGLCPPRARPADTNCDGTVDGADLGVLLSSWGSGNPAGDINGDGTVNGADLGLLLGDWG